MRKILTGSCKYSSYFYAFHTDSGPMEIFPFQEIRDEQSDMAARVEETVESGDSLIAHAPTGLGKTAAAVTPMLEDGIENDRTVFFLTPRHSQHEIALETVRKINDRHGKNLTAVDIIGRSHMCEADASTRAGEGPDCPRHDETFTEGRKLSERTKTMMGRLKNQNLTAHEVKEKCSKVCPYELQIQMMRDADVVVGDYFHLFHPGVREIVLERSDIEKEEINLVVDEAHNLPSRTRSLFSHTLSERKLSKAVAETERFGFYSEQEYLEQIESIMSSLASKELGMEEHEAEISCEDLKERIEEFRDIEDLVVDMETVAEEVLEENEESHCAAIAEFLESWTDEEEGFIRFIARDRGTDGNRYIKIKHSCLNPGLATSGPINEVNSTVLMSGTLRPQSMYADLLGVEEPQKATYSSPFPEENEKSLVVPTLTTKYSERDEEMIEKYGWYISKTLEAVDGNAAVFFPSYKLMHRIKEKMRDHTDRKLFVEERTMDKDEKQEMLDSFESTSSRGESVLLGVAAGSFGEGVDFPGDVLKSVFVVGIPLKKPGVETEGLVDYYDEKFGNGWDYGYTYPAMNRAVQAAGRCIRSRNDKGVIVYMDKRYDWSGYRKVFPPGKNLVSTKAPWKQTERFFT